MTKKSKVKTNDLATPTYVREQTKKGLSGRSDAQYITTWYKAETGGNEGEISPAVPSLKGVWDLVEQQVNVYSYESIWDDDEKRVVTVVRYSWLWRSAG